MSGVEKLRRFVRFAPRTAGVFVALLLAAAQPSAAQAPKTGDLAALNARLAAIAGL